MNTQPLTQGSKVLKNFYAFGVAALMSLALFVATTTPVLASPLVTFNGTGVGPIPDQPDPTAPCQTPGPPLNVTFNVTGLTANVQSLNVSVTLTHPYAGDVVARLIPPSGGNGFVLFGYIGSTSTAGQDIFGDSSNFGGTYVFSDAAPASPTLWQVAATAGGGDIITPGNYRTTTIGGSTAGGAVTSLNAAFAGLTPAQANGTWTLRVTDGCNEDTGSVSAAVLDITTAAAPVAAKPFFDYFGTGKSSFATYNRAGTNIIWRALINGATIGTTTETVFWGLSASDFMTPGYFDADNRADIGVWRPSTTAGESRFFIRNTNPVTLNAFPFGSSLGNTIGDFAGYDADYDGDGRDDPTTIRRVNGQWLWSYRASGSNNALRSVAFGAAGTQTEDVPMAGGDFSGDGRADLVVLRRNASGADTYIWGDSATGIPISSFIWGEYNTDFYVMGDFIGDARFDFAVWRGAVTGADGNWYIRENGGTGFVARNLGIPGDPTTATPDIAISGDFGGDSKYDIAIYRRSNNTFYWYNSLNELQLQGRQFGQAGDRPVGELRTY
jgi:subtilisin-like proprotein convertase family protein